MSSINNLSTDAQWVHQSFLVQQTDLQPVDQQNRFWSAASLSFTDTAPGGSLCINPPPQFTRYADLKPTDAMGNWNPNIKNRAGQVGKGRYYVEAIDDHSQIINMRFGLPTFNSLTTFFTGFYNTSAGVLARTGRAPSAFYELGRAAGFVVSILSWKLLAVTLLGNAARFFLQKPSSKFYYSKPAMPLYWNAVNTIVNQVAVNMGIVPRIGGTPLATTLAGGYQFDQAAQTKLSQLLPIFSSGGSVDVYALANRAQRLYRLDRNNIQQALDVDNLNITTAVQAAYQQTLTDTGGNGWTNYLTKWLGTSQAQTQADSGTTSSTTESLNDDPNGPVSPSQAYDSNFWDYLGAELDDGSAFVSFRVNATGPINESFSSQAQESDIAQKINSISSQSRSAEFDLANGNLGGGVIGETLGAAVGAVGNLVKGALDSVQLSGLAALGGAAFVDIPKSWVSSAASLPRMNYTINLVSPYGNKVSQLLNLYIPLAMLLAGALPISTGKQSYTSPFLVELFDKGRCQTRLGLIDSLSITRGTGNTGFNRDGHAMGIEVTFSVMDMSSILAMPISQGFSSGATSTLSTAAAVTGAITGASGGPVTAAVGAAVGATVGAGAGAVVDAANNVAQTIANLFDDDNAFSDYLAVLAGMGLADQIYSANKFKLNLTRAMTSWNTWYSVSHFASFMGDTLPGHLVSAIFKGTAR